jgi:hypothetical protein
MAPVFLPAGAWHALSFPSFAQSASSPVVQAAHRSTRRSRATQRGAGPGSGGCRSYPAPSADQWLQRRHLGQHATAGCDARRRGGELHARPQQPAQRRGRRHTRRVRSECRPRRYHAIDRSAAPRIHHRRLEYAANGRCLIACRHRATGRSVHADRRHDGQQRPELRRSGRATDFGGCE